MQLKLSKVMSKSFVKFFITSVLLINLFLFITTIILHEFGHYLVGKIYNCRDLKIVILDNNYGIHTEMKCLSYRKGLFELSGSFLVIPFSLIILFFLKKRHYFYLMNGFNLTFSFIDLQFLNLSHVTLLIGLVMILFSETKTINFALNSYFEKFTSI